MDHLCFFHEYYKCGCYHQTIHGCAFLNNDGTCGNSQSVINRDQENCIQVDCGYYHINIRGHCHFIKNGFCNHRDARRYGQKIRPSDRPDRITKIKKCNVRRCNFRNTGKINTVALEADGFCIYVDEDGYCDHGLSEHYQKKIEITTEQPQPQTPP